MRIRSRVSQSLHLQGIESVSWRTRIILFLPVRRVELLPDSPPCINHFWVLTEHPYSDNCSSYSVSVIPESTFDDVVSVQSLPCASRRDWIVYSPKKKKGKEKLMKEVGSHGASSLHCDQAKDFGESSWVFYRIIIFFKRTGLPIKGREMELRSFLASL